MRVGANVHLGHFRQGHVDLDPDKTVLQTALDAAGLLVSEARSYLGRYRFSGDDVFKRVGDLSGGEQARVALAVLTLQGANVLILDEPTNHLDIPSQEVLQEALSGFDGTLLIVSHDRYLIRRLTTSVWAIEDGRLWAFEEGYDAYQAWRERYLQEQQALRRAAREEAQAGSERERVRQARRASQREEARRARRQAELEDVIQDLQTHLTRLEGQIAAASEQQEVERVGQLGAEYGQVESELEELLVAWTEVAG